MKPNNTWPSAPQEIPIIGLKELPESTQVSFSPIKVVNTADR